jgi:ABC-type transporter Mla subunit MlaD
MADGNGERIKSALSELSKALKLSADGGAQTKEQLTNVVDNLSSLMDGAAASEGTLRDFGSTVRVLSQVLADEDLGSGTTGKQLNVILTQLSDLLEKNRDTIRDAVSNAGGIVTTTNAHSRELAELLDLAPLRRRRVVRKLRRDAVQHIPRAAAELGAAGKAEKRVKAGEAGKAVGCFVAFFGTRKNSL